MKKITTKFVILTAVSAILAFLMSGCGNVDGAPAPANSENTEEQTSSTISELAEGSVTAESSEPNENSEFPSKCMIYRQTPVQFTDEQLLDLFDAHKECGTPQKSEQWTDTYHRYDSEGAVGHVDNGYNLYFSTDKGSFFEDAIYYLEGYDEPDKEQLYTEGDLDFASRDEVLEKVRRSLSERYGIMPDEWWAFEFEAVKKECLEKVKQQAYHDAYEPDKEYAGDDLEKEKYYYEKIKDIPAEDFYYLDMRFKVDNIPLFMGGSLTIGDPLTGIRVQTSFFSLIYGKNGIERILISPAYETDRENAEEVELIPNHQAWELIQKKYDDIITAYPPELLDMKLFYLPIPQNNLGEYVQNFELRPCYGIFGTQTEEFEGETSTYNFATYFDAVTGDELATATTKGYSGSEASDWGLEE